MVAKAQERGRDRPVDEGTGDAHGPTAGIASASLLRPCLWPPLAACLRRRRRAVPARARLWRLSRSRVQCRRRPAERSPRARSGSSLRRACSTSTSAPSLRRAKPAVTTTIGSAQAFGNHGLGIVLLGDLDGAHRDLVVVADDIDEGPVGAALDRGGRHHDDVVERLEQEAHVDELAGPKLQRRVGKFGLEADRARRLVDLVVDDLRACPCRARRGCRSPALRP